MLKMSFKFVVLFVCVTFLQFCNAGAVTHEFTISYTNGESLTLTGDGSDLSREVASENCYTGVWLTYSGNYYQWGNFEVANEEQVFIHPQIEGTSEAVHDSYGRIWSARPVGSTTNNTNPSVSFFSVQALQDDIHVTEDGFPKIDFALKGLITINAEVEFFQGENYTGDSFCFEMDPNYCSNGVCWVWSWTEYEFPWFISLAKSARVGCSLANAGKTYFTPKGYTPQNYPTSFSKHQ